MSNEEMANKVIRAVLYLRLSNEDEGKTKEELSESIKNQELMLTNYAKEQGYVIVGVYNDEDWSGADSTRPEFNKMIKECELGNVDVVVAKTQSRFARDMELIEKYLHNKFHEWHVQFRTVVDRIDNTKRETKKTSQILGLTDEWYLEDTSLNIRATFKTKRENGEFTGSFAPYGYDKDPMNKNHLVIDPIASETVKRIYEDFVNGKGYKTIANELNNEGVLSPLEYKYMKGQNLKVPFITDYLFFDSIKKAGLYKIDISYINEEKTKLHNLIAYNILTEDNTTFDSKCKIYLRKVSDNTKIYYTTVKNIDLNNYNPDLWQELNINELLPNNVTNVIAKTELLDRTHFVNYQFEVLLDNNLEHKEYFYKIKHITNEEKAILKENIVIRKKTKWCDQMIKRLVTDEVYLGHLVQSKTSSISYKNKKKYQNPKEKWIRVENTHDAIISNELWVKAQERKVQKIRCNKTGVYNPLVNKLFCAECGRVFRRTGSTEHPYYSCKDNVEKYKSCNNRRHISYKGLHELLIDKINNILDRFYDEEKLNQVKEEDTDNLFKTKIISYQKELELLEREMQSKKNYFQRLYEDRANDIIDTNEYIVLKTKYKDDIDQVEERKKQIYSELENIKRKKEVLKSKNEILHKYKHIDSLNINIVSDFIDKVYIGNYNKDNKTRDITIEWNFEI